MEVLKGIEADYWRQQRLGVSRDVGGSVGEAIAAFARSRRELSTSWQEQIRKVLALLEGQVGSETEVTKVSREDVEQFLADGLVTRAPTTMRSYMAVVRCLFNWLEEEGWIRMNPARRVKLPKGTQRRGDCLMPGQAGAVLAACFRVQPVFGVIATAIVLGSFRKGEVVNLWRDEMDLVNRWALVTDFEGDEQANAWSAKSESSRRAVPLHPALADMLRQVEPVTRPDGSASPWVFPIVDGRKRKRLYDGQGRPRPMLGDRRSPDTTYFGRCLRKALALAGIQRQVTVHGLRRTFAVLLQDAGAPDSIIRQAMGHAARGVTERHYLPRRDRMVQHWVDQIRIEIPAVEIPGMEIPSGKSPSEMPAAPPSQPRAERGQPEAPATMRTGQSSAPYLPPVWHLRDTPKPSEPPSEPHPSQIRQ